MVYKIIDINLEKIWGQKKIKDKTIGEIIKFEINEERSNDVIDSFGNKYSLYSLYSGKEKVKIFGKRYQNIKKFPFLVKYIYSSQKLSVQVHPKEKKETWLFLKDNSKILIGLKNKLKKEELTIPKLLDNVNIVEMSKYDFAVVEPGIVHSIFEDNAVCEVQNNYDVTYRYYDWDNNRKLTQKEFVDNLNSNKFDLKKNIWQDFSKYRSDKFDIKKYSIKKSKKFSKTSYFKVLIVLEGNGKLNIGSESVNITSEESYLISANTEYQITGNVEVLIIS